MEKIKDIWSGLSKKGKIASVALVAIVVLIIWGQIF
jgi:flagellar biosynthesis/type III secretory pathway M-ring protein FliF/YscJ|tara:strand:- start:43 stop:150 length:108 start_codon:yes stop_codon:yes gene_type:complete